MFPATLLHWYLVGTIIVPSILAARYFPSEEGEAQLRAILLLTPGWLPFLLLLFVLKLLGKSFDDL